LQGVREKYKQHKVMFYTFPATTLFKGCNIFEVILLLTLLIFILFVTLEKYADSSFIGCFVTVQMCGNNTISSRYTPLFF